jgi:cytochrome-b5 reductase
MFRSAIAGARNGGIDAAGLSMRSSFVARQATRSFASEIPKPVKDAAQAGASSNLPLILALGGLGGFGAWYYMGGFGDQKSAAAIKAAVPSSIGGGALNPKEFIEFTLKEVIPYNHDSST